MKLPEINTTFWLMPLCPVLILHAALGIQKILTILYSKLTRKNDNETSKALVAIENSCENLITAKNDSHQPINAKRFIQVTTHIVTVFLPLFFFLFSTSFIISSIVAKLHYDITKAVIPCNKNETKIFKDFVTSWKERNEAQMELVKWVDAFADNNTFSSNNDQFMQKLQTVKKSFKSSNAIALAQPEFCTYKECFFANGSSKRNFIRDYYSSPRWIFANSLMTIFCFIAISYSRFLGSQKEFQKRRFGKFILPVNEIVTCLFLIMYGQISLILLNFSSKIDEVIINPSTDKFVF